MFKFLGALGVFIFVSVVLTWHEAYGAEKDPVYHHILRVAPKTPNAMELSNQIVKVGKQLGVNPHLIVAIAAQESGLRHINRVVGVIGASGCKVRVTDYGILQVNEHSIKAYGLNASLLAWNRDYQLWAGVMILADKIRVFGHWSAYHSMTPKHNQQYRQLVGRYL